MGFSRISTNFTGVATSSNEKLQNGQVKTHDGLSYEETTALERLSGTLIELSLLSLLSFLGSYTVEERMQQAGWLLFTTKATRQNL